MSELRCELCGSVGPCFNHTVCKICETHYAICGTCMYADFFIKSIQCVRCVRDKQIDIIIYDDGRI